MELTQLECLSHLFGFKFSNGQRKSEKQSLENSGSIKQKLSYLLRRTDSNKKYTSP